MDSLVVPGLDTLRRWLDEIGISFFECDSCQALHLPHMQNFDGIFDAKIDLVDNVVLFSALAEVKDYHRDLLFALAEEPGELLHGHPWADRQRLANHQLGQIIVLNVDKRLHG